MGTIQIDGSTPKLTIGNATAEDALIVFDGNAQDFYIGLDDSADDLVIGLGSAAGTTPAISINEDRDVTISDGAIDFDIASHDTSNGLKLGGTLVTATAAELNIMDGVTSTAAEINLIDGGTARGTTALADGDGILINDAGTMRMTNVTAVKTYMGLAVGDITGATALAEQPQGTDEMVISDGGTLKRLDVIHVMNRPFFRAYMSDHQEIDTATTTVVAFDEEIDTTVAGTGGDPDSTYNTSTYRWTPAVAGFYFIGFTLHIPNIDDGELMTIQIRKNGAVVGHDNTHGGQLWNQLYSSGTTMGSLTGCGVIPLDNDDYVDLTVYHNEGAAQSVQYWYSHFFGWKIAGA